MKLEQKQISAIKLKFSAIENRDDLLVLINYTKTALYGEKVKPFTLKQLTYFVHPENCKNRYRTFSIKKKSGGERQINSPADGLRSILRVLNVIFQCCSTPHESANGFVLNKSIVTNAKRHLNKHYVYNIDLKDFFHSFDRNRVKMALMREPFSLNGDKEPVAFIIASLCTHPLLIDGTLKVVLPQGSPTSPTLTNLLCLKLDRRLNGLAKKIGADYSRYADDITFSSHRNVFNSETFIKELKRIIEVDQDLRINDKKTRLQKFGFRQEVTGLTVNEKVNVQKRYVKQTRMWIYYWEKYGYTKAQQIFIKNYTKDKGHVKNLNSQLSNVISGKLDFLKMVKGEEDSTYSTLNKRFQKLKEANSADKIKIREVLKLWENDGIESAMDYYYGKGFKINDFDDVIQIPNIDTLLKDDEIINKIIESLKNDGLL
jgi:RNA-directed DNA polymerase